MSTRRLGLQIGLSAVLILASLLAGCSPAPTPAPPAATEAPSPATEAAPVPTEASRFVAATRISSPTFSNFTVGPTDRASGAVGGAARELLSGRLP